MCLILRGDTALKMRAPALLDLGSTVIFWAEKKIHNSRIKEKIRASCNMNVLTTFVIIISVLIRMRTPSNWSKRKLFTNLKSNKTVIVSKLILLKPRILYTSKYMYLIDSCLLDLVKCKT